MSAQGLAPPMGDEGSLGLEKRQYHVILGWPCHRQSPEVGREYSDNNSFGSRTIRDLSCLVPILFFFFGVCVWVNLPTSERHGSPWTRVSGACQYLS